MIQNNFKIVVQARTNSTRFPQKIVVPVDKDKTFLHIILSRLLGLKDTVEIVIATSDLESDNVIEDIGNEMGIVVFRGSENNVLNRFIECSKKHQITHIVRVCSDNPFIDLSSIRKLISAYNDEDYLSYSVNGKPSILTHYGFFPEIVSLKALLAVEEFSNPGCVEHVTNCIYTDSNKFNVKLIPITIESESIRCTLDTKEDFESLTEIYFNWYKKIKPDEFEYRNLIDFIESEPSLLTKMENQIKNNTK